MGLFKKTPADLKVRAELDLRKAERALITSTEAARKAVADLQAVADEERSNAQENIERVARGEPAVRIYQDMGLYQDQETACAAALARAETTYERALETLREAVHVERCARRDALVREIAEQLTASLAKGDALRAVYDEDQPRQSLVEFPWLGDQIRSWMIAADQHLNPPPAKALDPSMTLVRFVAGFPGRAASNFRRSIAAYGVGETAAFGKAEADFLFELGVVELVSPETTDEEAA